MADHISDELIEKILHHCDIVDVVSQYVHLKKRGRNYFGLCPFHSEKTPSFSVASDKQIFKCFGCGAGGNVISFIMKIEELDFIEALSHLAEKYGIEFDTSSLDRSKAEKNGHRHHLYSAYERTAKLFQHILLNLEYGKAALQYLKIRGFTDETIKEFQLGFAPNAWDFLTSFLKKRGYNLDEMVKAGLLSKRESDGKPYDRFRGRVMFPIWDFEGKVIAFGGRVIGEGNPKYLNSPESELFHKGYTLFNFHRARKEIRKKSKAVLFEGYIDVISAWQAGVKNGIATLGTSLTENQARLLRRNAETVTICYDSDNAGIEAAFRASELLAAVGCRVDIAVMPEGMDPDDYIRKYGGEAFQSNILLQALPLTAFKLHYLRRGKNLNNEAEKFAYLEEALREISQLSNAIERDHYLRELAREFDLSLDALKKEQYKLWKQQKKSGKRDKVVSRWNNTINNGKYVSSSTILPAYHQAERALIAYMLRDEEIVKYIRDNVGDQFNIEQHAAIAAHLYRFTESGNHANLTKFISYLEDPELIQLVSELAMINIDENISAKVLDDYVKQVLNYPKRKQIENLEKEIKELEKMGNHMEAAKIALQITQLKKSLKA